MLETMIHVWREFRYEFCSKQSSVFIEFTMEGHFCLITSRSYSRSSRRDHDNDLQARTASVSVSFLKVY